MRLRFTDCMKLGGMWELCLETAGSQGRAEVPYHHGLRSTLLRTAQNVAEKTQRAFLVCCLMQSVRGTVDLEDAAARKSFKLRILVPSMPMPQL